MIRMHRSIPAALAMLLPVAAVQAAALVITKSSAVVADSFSLTNPKALPGATVDYAITVRNPNGLTTSVGVVAITDTLPTSVVLNTGSYGTATGPIEFADGNLLGLGLLGSGLTYTFRGLADDTDSVEFSNGITWSYHPVAGYDPAVQAIRVTLAGTQVAGTSFRLRFRVRVK